MGLSWGQNEMPFKEPGVGEAPADSSPLQTPMSVLLIFPFNSLAFHICSDSWIKKKAYLQPGPSVCFANKQMWLSGTQVLLHREWDWQQDDVSGQARDLDAELKWHEILPQRG